MCTKFQVEVTDPSVVVEVRALPEDAPIEGNALASGDAFADAREEQRIRAARAAGLEWAWCTAYVRVTYRGLLDTDAYLAEASFTDEAAFRGSVEYRDMVAGCLLELNRRLVLLCGPESAS